MTSVLIVDDQFPFRRAARSVIDALEDFEVVGEADSGEQALSLAGQLHPAVVLMDVNMPGMDGLEVTRRMVAADPNVFVILVSTLTYSDLPGGAAASGARAYLSKELFGGEALRRIWQRGPSGAFIAAGG